MPHSRSSGGVADALLVSLGTALSRVFSHRASLRSSTSTLGSLRGSKHTPAACWPPNLRTPDIGGALGRRFRCYRWGFVVAAVALGERAAAPVFAPAGRVPLVGL